MRRLLIGSLLFCMTSFALANPSTIPKQYQGVWDKKISQCSPKGAELSQSSTLIDQHNVKGYESSCSLKVITKMTALSLTGLYSCNDEDGDSDNTFTLYLKGHKLVVGTSDSALIRCP